MKTKPSLIRLLLTVAALLFLTGIDERKNSPSVEAAGNVIIGPAEEHSSG